MSALVTAAGCAPQANGAAESALFVYRFDPPAFLELDGARNPVREIPFSMPQGCDLSSVHAAPHGYALAIELSCAFGPAVVWLDAGTGSVRQPITDSDSHFLAWATDGRSIYLRIDSVNRPRIVRVALTGELETLPISDLTYDLAPAPSGREFLFAFSRGMGLGSEIWLADHNGVALEQLAMDPGNYLALARWSPDGQLVAFIKIPDSARPFTIGELWVMRADGTSARMLASADAGHGFAPAWSPDGSQIAFVVRGNPDDPSADISSEALVSNLSMVSPAGGEVGLLTNLSRGAT